MNNVMYELKSLTELQKMATPSKSTMYYMVVCTNGIYLTQSIQNVVMGAEIKKISFHDTEVSFKQFTSNSTPADEAYESSMLENCFFIAEEVALHSDFVIIKNKQIVSLSMIDGQSVAELVDKFS